MNNSINNESPILSSQIVNNNSSMIPDILEQIKKKSEEISTSDASIKLLQNLSNPTNLTNPQIITTLNHNQNKAFKKMNKLPSLKKNKLIFSNDNTKKNLAKSKSELVLTNLNQFSTIDPFNLDNYHKLIEKAELDILNENNKKVRNKIKLEKIRRNIISERESYRDRYNRNINSIYYNMPEQSQEPENENIWDKIKKSNILMKNKEKDIRIYRRKFISKKEYLEKTNLIKLLQFTNKNKNERYNNYLSLKNLRMKSTDNAIDRLKKSKDFLDKKYNVQFVSYIQFLGNEIEKEKNKDIDLIKEKNEILAEVSKLQKQINKIKNNMTNLINWLYLQIQVKENLPYLPEYYKLIIEEEYSLDEVNEKGKGKYNINFDEYFRIRDYIGTNPYEDANDFLKKIDELEIKSLTILNNKLDLLEEDKILKKELEDLKKENIIKTKNEDDKYNELIYQLNDAKKNSILLKNKLIYVKNIKNKKKKTTDKLLLNKIAAYAQLNSNVKGMNFILKNKKSMLYYFTLCLYYILDISDFEEIKKNKLALNIYKNDNKMMLDTLDSAEKLLNLLLTEKKYYYSNQKLKIIYEQATEEEDKKTKIEKMLVQIKLRKHKELEKKEKLEEKINKKYYKPTRKIDYDYYRREMNKKNKTIVDKTIKNETKFEDFLYDIYS